MYYSRRIGPTQYIVQSRVPRGIFLCSRISSTLGFNTINITSNKSSRSKKFRKSIQVVLFDSIQRVYRTYYLSICFLPTEYSADDLQIYFGYIPATTLQELQLQYSRLCFLFYILL